MDIATILLSGLSIIIGAIIAIVIAVSIENLRKPRLRLRISPPSDRDFEHRHAKKARFLLLELGNQSLPSYAKWMTRNPALQCHGIIRFYRLDGHKIFNDDMDVRWSSTPEPVPVIIIDEKNIDRRFLLFDHTRVLLEQRKDIYPGESGTFAVAARFDDDNECYGWNNESYFTAWRNPRFKLEKGAYLITAEITSSGEKCTGLYRLINEGTLKDFRMVDSLPSDHVEDEYP